MENVMAMQVRIGERVLEDLVRDLIQHADLPRECPTQMWGGPGKGSLCDICAQPIRATEAEFELVFQSPRDMRLCVHAGCYEAWELERQCK